MAKDTETGGQNGTPAALPPVEDQAEKWLETARLNAALTAPQRGFMRDLHRLLEASPDAEKPVTGTTIFGVVASVAQEALTAQGVLDIVEEKTPVQLLKEGREARAAAAKEAKPVGAADSEGTPKASAAGGHGSAPAAPETAGLPELREGAKILEECREPGACHACKAPFPAKSRVPYEPGGRGEKGRTWGPGCCPVAEALLAQLAGSSS